ncbi:MAG TPA: hypothetical protein PLJ60_05790 [Chryseolinea sp.]|nr:hypothetical protein [Chryseolinea sp.]HPM29830.1 hypothetical protein [Chryseolinea sp.]
MKLPDNTRNLFLILTLIAISFIFSSCSKKISFLNSSVVPAAEGTVKVSKDKNKNSVIKVSIKNLAEPDRLQPARKVYIVWMLTDNDMTKNIGQIKTSRTFFNKRLEGSFETISSFKPVKIFITAEDDADIQYPQEEVVLSTSNF